MAEEITKDTETTEVVEKTVPYERFKLVNEERNTYKTSVAEICYNRNRQTYYYDHYRDWESFIVKYKKDEVKTLRLL